MMRQASPFVMEVPGVEAVYAYRMLPNQRGYFIDTTEDTFYLKATDSAGFATVRRFRFNEDPFEQAQPPQQSQYATHDEVAALSASVTALAGKMDHLSEIMEALNG
jgi:hypothetical protein